MTEIKVIATGLRFPEGPVVLEDGSIAVVEIARGTVSRVALDGTVSVIADLGGGPNGLALGPDGDLYVCNNGGFEWHEEPGLLRPILTPNGIGLSPDEKTFYVAETEGGRLWAFDITEPGVVKRQPFPSPNGGRFLFNEAGYHRFDSLAVDAAGNVCVATLGSGAIPGVAPDGRL